MAATMYGFWLIYAAGLHYVLMSTILYALGIFVFKKAWTDNGKKGTLFTPAEKVIAIILVILAIGALGMMVSGILPVEKWVHWFQHHAIKRN
jgi:arginine:ornithine antiporter/lysine permease